MAASERAGLARHCEKLLARAAGRVLEIGGGTGANLPFYSDRVTELVITEPEEPMRRRLERKLGGYRIPTRMFRAGADQLPARARVRMIQTFLRSDLTAVRQRADVVLRHAAKALTREEAESIATRYDAGPAQVATAVKATALVAPDGRPNRRTVELHRLLDGVQILAPEVRDELIKRACWLR